MAFFAHFMVFTELNKTHLKVVKFEILKLQTSSKLCFSSFIVQLFQQEKM